MQPLVTCVCPTFNRAMYIQRAIKSFQFQTYLNKELLIVDNGDDDTRSLIPNDPMIRYLQVSSKRTTGEMRNLCAEEARGSILCHFDSDDWSAPTRVEEQVQRLGTDGVLTGYFSILFFDERDKMVYRYQHNKPGFALGTSLCYTKEWWSSNPFDSVIVGEDTKFFLQAYRFAKDRVTTAMGDKILVASVHSHQTSRKSLVPPQYQMLRSFVLPKGFYAVQRHQ